MDPQLYKLLEVSWEAWMDSGIDVRALRDSNRVGVYTGICGSEVCGAPLCTITVYLCKTMLNLCRAVCCVSALRGLKSNVSSCNDPLDLTRLEFSNAGARHVHPQQA